MFKSSKNNSKLGKVETLISQDTSIDGIVEAGGTIRVDGTVKGGVKKAIGIIIGDTGIIEGNIQGNVVSVAGKVKGDIRAESSLELLPDSTIVGDIETSKLSISEGSHFDGACHMIEENSPHPKKNKRSGDKNDFTNPEDPT